MHTNIHTAFGSNHHSFTERRLLGLALEGFGQRENMNVGRGNERLYIRQYAEQANARVNQGNMLWNQWAMSAWSSYAYGTRALGSYLPRSRWNYYNDQAPNARTSWYFNGGRNYRGMGGRGMYFNGGGAGRYQNALASRDGGNVGGGTVVNVWEIEEAGEKRRRLDREEAKEAKIRRLNPLPPAKDDEKKAPKRDEEDKVPEKPAEKPKTGKEILDDILKEYKTKKSFTIEEKKKTDGKNGVRIAFNPIKFSDGSVAVKPSGNAIVLNDDDEVKDEDLEIIIPEDLEGEKGPKRAEQLRKSLDSWDAEYAGGLVKTKEALKAKAEADMKADVQRLADYYNFGAEAGSSQWQLTIEGNDVVVTPRNVPGVKEKKVRFRMELSEEKNPTSLKRLYRAGVRGPDPKLAPNFFGQADDPDNRFNSVWKAIFPLLEQYANFEHDLKEEKVKKGRLLAQEVIDVIRKDNPFGGGNLTIEDLRFNARKSSAYHGASIAVTDNASPPRTYRYYIRDVGTDDAPRMSVCTPGERGKALPIGDPDNPPPPPETQWKVMTPVQLVNELQSDESFEIKKPSAHAAARTTIDILSSYFDLGGRTLESEKSEDDPKDVKISVVAQDGTRQQVCILKNRSIGDTPSFKIDAEKETGDVIDVRTVKELVNGLYVILQRKGMEPLAKTRGMAPTEADIATLNDEHKPDSEYPLSFTLEKKPLPSLENPNFDAWEDHSVLTISSADNTSDIDAEFAQFLLNANAIPEDRGPEGKSIVRVRIPGFTVAKLNDMKAWFKTKRDEKKTLEDKKKEEDRLAKIVSDNAEIERAIPDGIGRTYFKTALEIKDEKRTVTIKQIDAAAAPGLEKQLKNALKAKSIEWKDTPAKDGFVMNCTPENKDTIASILKNHGDHYYLRQRPAVLNDKQPYKDTCVLAVNEEDSQADTIGPIALTVKPLAGKEFSQACKDQLIALGAEPKEDPSFIKKIDIETFGKLRKIIEAESRLNQANKAIDEAVNGFGGKADALVTACKDENGVAVKAALANEKEGAERKKAAIGRAIGLDAFAQEQNRIMNHPQVKNDAAKQKKISDAVDKAITGSKELAFPLSKKIDGTLEVGYNRDKAMLLRYRVLRKDATEKANEKFVKLEGIGTEGMTYRNIVFGGKNTLLMQEEKDGKIFIIETTSEDSLPNIKTVDLWLEIPEKEAAKFLKAIDKGAVNTWKEFTVWKAKRNDRTGEMSDAERDADRSWKYALDTTKEKPVLYADLGKEKKRKDDSIIARFQKLDPNNEKLWVPAGKVPDHIK
jgi:hypothetical protein